MPIAVLLCLAAVSVAIAAMASMGEAALMMVSRSAIGEDRQGLRVVRLLDDPQLTRGALSFIRVFAEVTASACATLLVAVWVDVWWQRLIAALLVSLGIAVLAIRISPRTIAHRYPLPILRALGPVLLAFVALARWAARSSAPQDDYRELASMVERVQESHAIADEERELIRSVFELGHTLTREVMVPRTAMVTISPETSLREAQDIFLQSGFSRIPVTGLSTDDVIGVCYFKDVVRTVAANPHAAHHLVPTVIRPATFVPESKPADDLLREIQQSPSHLAMVVDEYGGIAGLVTIEDVLEEIVGELTDEYDPPVLESEELEDGRLRVPARLNLDELSDLVGFDIHDDDVDTVGGLLAKALGKVPLVGSVAQCDGLELTAERTEGRRKQLATVLVTRVGQTAPELGPTPES